MQRYHKTARKQPASKNTAAIVLGLMCVGLFFVVAILWINVSTASSELAEKVRTNNALTAKNRNLEDKNRFLQDKAVMGGSQGYVGISKGGKAPEKSAQYYYDRCKRLERELSAAEKLAEFYRRYLPKDTRERLKMNEDISVENIKVNPCGNGVKASFQIRNRTARHMNNVTGNIRFWYGDQIAYEGPFLIRRIEARSVLDMFIDVPIKDYTHYSGHVKAGGSY